MQSWEVRRKHREFTDVSSITSTCDALKIDLIGCSAQESILSMAKIYSTMSLHS